MGEPYERKWILELNTFNGTKVFLKTINPGKIDNALCRSEPTPMPSGEVNNVLNVGLTRERKRGGGGREIKRTSFNLYNFVSVAFFRTLHGILSHLYKLIYIVTWNIWMYIAHPVSSSVMDSEYANIDYCNFFTT